MQTRQTLWTGLALLAGLVAACADASDAASNGRPQTVVATELRFAPDRLTAPAGRPVQLKLRNEGSVDHDWVVVELPVTGVADDQAGGHVHTGGTGHGDHVHAAGPATVVAHAAPGTESRIWFTPTEAGRYAFYCSLPGHREAGMHGVLIVE